MNINVKDLHDAVIRVTRLRMLGSSRSPGCSGCLGLEPRASLRGSGEFAGQSISGLLNWVLVLLVLLVPSTVLLEKEPSVSIDLVGRRKHGVL